MGKFNAEEFVQLINSRDKTETLILCQKVFDDVDTDHSGFIDQKEMLEMMVVFDQHAKQNRKNPIGWPIEELSEAQLMEMGQEFLSEMDVNKDGKVSYDEFLKYVMTQKKNDGDF